MERFGQYSTWSSFVAVHSSPQNDSSDLCVPLVVHRLCCSTTGHPLVLFEMLRLRTCGLMLSTREANSEHRLALRYQLGPCMHSGLRGLSNQFAVSGNC